MEELKVGDRVTYPLSDKYRQHQITYVYDDGYVILDGNLGPFNPKVLELVESTPTLVETTIEPVKYTLNPEGIVGAPDEPLVASKNDKKDGKSPLEYLRMDGISEMCEVFAFGATKYGKDNYLLGHHVDQLTAAALRHILAYQAGEELDPESGKSHIGHAMCCLSMLQTQKALNTLRRD